MADLNIGNSSASVVVNAKHNGSVIPQINNTYDLGTSDLRWKNIYGNLKGNSDTATHFENNSFRTLRDFTNGTLITTDLNGGTTNSSIPFYVEIVGNGYGNGLVAAYCQGYVYHLGDGYSQYINCDAYSIGKSFTNTIYAFSNSNGKLCFWFASMAYWQGFDIKVYDTSESINTKKLINHVVSVTNVTLPTTRSWETQITVRKFIDSGLIDNKYVKKSGDTMTGNLAAPSIYTSDWFRSTGATGWYSQTYGGGWYMSDSTYIRNYNSKTVRLDNLCLGADNNNYRLYVNGTQYIQSSGSASGTNGLTINNGVLAITNYNQTLTIGPFNTAYTHFITDGSSIFYFNKSIDINGNLTKYNYSSEGYGTISGYNLNGNAATATNADKLDNKHANEFIHFSYDTGLGNGSPADIAKSYFVNDDKTPKGMLKGYYNHNGVEYSQLYSRSSSGSYGSILRWGYNNKYMYILRYRNGWQSEDWEKMDAGNADTATKLATARNITIGNKTNSFNGSANISYNLQDVLIRAGNEFNYTADGIAGLWFNYRTQTGTNSTTKITNYYFGNGQCGIDGVTINASNFSGNAATATRLATARTIRTNLASTYAVAFDGSASITTGVTGTLPIANGGTGATTASSARNNLGAQSKVLYGSSAPSDSTGSNGDMYIALESGDFKKDIVDLIYPIGSIYISMNSTNPSTLFGGTWEAFGQGRVLIGAGTGNDGSTNISFTAGGTGGEYKHTLSVSEMPSHTHTQNAHNHTVGAHSHGLNSHTHSYTKATGVAGHTLTTAEMPSHYHTFGTADRQNNIVTGWADYGLTMRTGSSYDISKETSSAGGGGSHNHGLNTSSATTGAASGSTAKSAAFYSANTTATNQNTGGGASHNNIQPYIGVYMWKRTA